MQQEGIGSRDFDFDLFLIFWKVNFIVSVYGSFYGGEDILDKESSAAEAAMAIHIFAGFSSVCKLTEF